MNGVLFKDLKIDEKSLSECNPVYRSDDDNTRLYIVQNDPIRLDWFGGMAVTLVSSLQREDWWNDPYLEVEILFKLHAAYDGIRHIWFGEAVGDAMGYIYYPDMVEFVEMFSIIHEWEKKFCALDL